MKKYYYVYRITCLHSDSIEKYYYGYRSCNCLPSEDLYWSSSEYVKEAIKIYGISYFKKKIIRIFNDNDKDEAFALEKKLHVKFKVDTNVLFFNRIIQTSRITGTFALGKTYEEMYGSKNTWYDPQIIIPDGWKKGKLSYKKRSYNEPFYR